ncbi:MAG: DUF5320 domain-containing protein [Anaerolineales bacterium]|nr:DUF5320 domain-containing protein [Anaerolineales bacterium]
MPAGDRTGPRGMGPMTGRGAGYCAGYGTPGYTNPMPGRGYGMGWGRGGGWGGGWGAGRGFRNMYYATGLPGWARYGAPVWGAFPVSAYAPYGVPPTPEQETAFLKSQAEMLKKELDAIGKRVAEIEKKE